MQWNNFLCNSPPETKFFRPNLHTRSSAKFQHTLSSNKIKSTKEIQENSILQKESSISALFLNEIKEFGDNNQIIRDMRDAILEMRDIQKLQLEVSKRTLRALKDGDKGRDKSFGAIQTIKKKRNDPICENTSTKLKEFDKLKNDVTLRLKKSRSNQKTEKKSKSSVKFFQK